MGIRAYKIIQRKVRPQKPRKKKIIEVEVDHNYAAQNKDKLVLDRPAWDPTSETGLFKKVLNVAAKMSYKRRSERF